MDNKRADELAKKGADTPFTGPEPVLGQASNRGLDGEETHKSAGSLVKTASTPRLSWKGLIKAGLLNC